MLPLSTKSATHNKFSPNFGTYFTGKLGYDIKLPSPSIGKDVVESLNITIPDVVDNVNVLVAIKLRLLTHENVAPESIMGNEAGKLLCTLLVYNTRIDGIVDI